MMNAHYNRCTIIVLQGRIFFPAECFANNVKKNLAEQVICNMCM